PSRCRFLFFIVRAPPEFYTLSLHDALPIYLVAAVVDRARTDAAGRARASSGPPRGGVALLRRGGGARLARAAARPPRRGAEPRRDRKSTRLNSSHVKISYAVFCLKKKKL